MNNYYSGKNAEQCAARYLIDHGYNIIQQRYKTKYGEIDIVAETRQTIVFVEVKFRKSMRDSLEAISLRQQNRIKAAAQLFLSLSQNIIDDYDVRFDAILYDQYMNLYHIENAF